jgi:hypothetical protein
MGFSSLAPGGRPSGGWLTLHLLPGERNAHARRPARVLSLSPAHISSMSAAGQARQCGAKTRVATAAHAAHFRTGKVAALQKNL